MEKTEQQIAHEWWNKVLRSEQQRVLLLYKYGLPANFTDENLLGMYQSEHPQIVPKAKEVDESLESKI